MAVEPKKLVMSRVGQAEVDRILAPLVMTVNQLIERIRELQVAVDALDVRVTELE